jgi:hypothetical protein
MERDVRRHRETLIGEISYLVKLGQARSVDVWDPSLVRMAVPRMRAEYVPRFYEEAYMCAGAEECAMRQFCCCNTLCLLIGGAGFIAKPYLSPTDRSFEGLCVLCVKLLMARDGLELYQSARPFRVTSFVYLDGARMAYVD